VERGGRGASGEAALASKINRLNDNNRFSELNEF
jgi:hypothetical protein